MSLVTKPASQPDDPELDDIFLAARRPANPAALAAAAALTEPRYQQALASLRRGLLLDCDDTINTNHDEFLHSRYLLTDIYLRLCADAYTRKELGLWHRRIDDSLVPEYGFVPKRWLTSAEQAAREIAGRELTADEIEEVAQAASVGVGIGVLHTGVGETLAELRRHGVDMALLTKGEASKQQEKVEGHGLDEIFSGRVMIVERKNAEVIREAVERFALADPVIIGDSESSDIKPALEAGFAAIHIDRGSVSWKVEQPGEVSHSAKVGSLPEAVKLLLDAEMNGGF